jgi:hypothetical protein
VPAEHFAYLLISAPLPNVYLGGAMVTDSYGLPLEFRYTDPIQPSRLQQVLYGAMLGQYIKQDVIFNHLLKSLESQFRFLLVNDESLLQASSKLSRMCQVSKVLVEAGGYMDLPEPLSRIKRALELLSKEALSREALSKDGLKEGASSREFGAE